MPRGWIPRQKITPAARAGHHHNLGTQEVRTRYLGPRGGECKARVAVGEHAAFRVECQDQGMHRGLETIEATIGNDGESSTE